MVQLIKGTFRGRFETIANDDLYSCLTLLAKEGYVSETKLTLIEEFLTPNSNSPEQVKERIELFKASDQLKFERENVLQGRDEEIKEILTKLETDQFPILNLYGSAGVGKTTLAREICSKWQGKPFTGLRKIYDFDLRKARNVKELCIDVMSSLGETASIEQFITKNREQRRTTPDKKDAGYRKKNSKEPNLREHTPKEMSDNRSSIDDVHVDMSKLRKLRDKIQELNSEGQAVLFLFDDVNSLVQKDENQAEAFLQFLRDFLQHDGESKSNVCKVLLTSRGKLHDEMVNNIEVKALVRDSAHEILLLNGITHLNAEENEKVIDLCQGNPLLLNAVSSVLRQQRGTSTVRDLIVGIDKKGSVPEKGTLDEYVKEKETFDFEKEGIDVKQVYILKEMFDSLPSYYLKSSAIAVSLFCGPFSPSYGKAVLGAKCVSEAVVVLEGLRMSKIISLRPDTKELMYDIHPLLKKYVNNLVNDPKYKQDYEKAKGKFFELFWSELETIAELVDRDYLAAFEQFEMNRPNFELVLEISRSPHHFGVPREFQKTAAVVSLFEVLLSKERVVPLLRLWADKCEGGELGNYFVFISL